MFGSKTKSAWSGPNIVSIDRERSQDPRRRGSKPALIAGNQLRIERPLPVARNAEIELRGLGQHPLLRITVAGVALPRRRLTALWPAAGFVDTEKRCLMKLEVVHGKASVSARVQG